MNVLGALLTSIITAIGKRAIPEAGPFIIQEINGLSEQAVALTSVLFDGSLSHDEKKELFHVGVVGGLKTLVAAAEKEGGDISADLPLILTQAIGDEVAGALGFSNK